MLITKKIDNIVKSISKTSPKGNTFFDAIDSEIKKNENFDIINALFKEIYKNYGFNYNLVISGGFGELIMSLIKSGKVKCKGSIIQTAGGLTSHFTDMDKIVNKKNVRIEKKIGDIENKHFVFVDDSYYSGSTLYAIKDLLLSYNSKVVKVYVIYDGNDKKSQNRFALYNYYDWNKGSRTHDELVEELEKYENIPTDVFKERIVRGDITSIIQLRKEINNFKIKSNQDGINVYGRIRESHIKNFKNFNI